MLDVYIKIFDISKSRWWKIFKPFFIIFHSEGHKNWTKTRSTSVSFPDLYENLTYFIWIINSNLEEVPFNENNHLRRSAIFLL